MLCATESGLGRAARSEAPRRPAHSETIFFAQITAKPFKSGENMISHDYLLTVLLLMHMHSLNCWVLFERGDLCPGISLAFKKGDLFLWISFEKQT